MAALNAPCVILAPMVRGSELAFRMLCRAHGAHETWSPMLRAGDVLAAAEHRLSATLETPLSGDTITSPGSAAKCPLSSNDRLFLPDTCAEERPHFVVQICGSDPAELARATTAILVIYPGLKGIDFNLGCPQAAADKEHFGAFLVERDPDLAVKCVSSISRAAATHAAERKQEKVRVSAKMRLLEDIETGIAFAHRLVHEASLDLLTVHCRQRREKHEGEANWAGGKAFVDALDIPVVINGGVASAAQARQILEETGAAGVMAARGFLRNPRMLREKIHESKRTDDEECTEAGLPANAASHSTSGSGKDRLSHSPAYLAAEYLDYCEKYPPPSTLYIRKHLRWIFREELQPAQRYPGAEVFRDPLNGWRPRLWTFLVRPYIDSLTQFRALVGLYCTCAGIDPMPASVARLPPETFSFKAIRNL